MACLQEQSHDSGTQPSNNQQSSSYNSPNIIFPSQEMSGGPGARGAHHGIGGAHCHHGSGRGHHHVDPPTQVSVSETGRISTDFAFDNPQYSLSDRDALRDTTLTKIRSPPANSGEGDILSHIIEDISTEMSTSTGSFVFGKKITGDDQSGERFSSNDMEVDVTGVSESGEGIDKTSWVTFPTDDSTVSARTQPPMYVAETTTSDGNVPKIEDATIPDSVAETETFNSTSVLDQDHTVCYTSDASAKGKLQNACCGGGSQCSGKNGGVGTQVMITVHSSPDHISHITDAFDSIKKKHSLKDAKLQLVMYVAMQDNYIAARKEDQTSNTNTSDETYEPNLTDRSHVTTTTEISSDAIKGGEDFSKSDTTATEVKTKSDTTATEVTINTDSTVIKINTDTTHDSSITDDQNKTPGDPSKTETNDSDITVDPNQTNEEVVTPKSPNNEDIDKTKEKVVPTLPDGDSNPNDDDNNNEIDKAPGDPDKTNENVVPNVIDITNDDDAVTPKEATGKDTPSPAEPKKEEESSSSSLDVPGTMEYLARIKAYMNRPKKIKEFIDHEMKMEQVLVEEFLDKSDATKGPEIGLFMFLYFVPYSIMTQF